MQIVADVIYADPSRFVYQCETFNIFYSFKSETSDSYRVGTSPVGLYRAFRDKELFVKYMRNLETRSDVLREGDHNQHGIYVVAQASAVHPSVVRFK